MYWIILRYKQTLNTLAHSSTNSSGQSHEQHYQVKVLQHVALSQLLL